MKIKPKGWIWKLTGPFASNNYTTIWNTIYCPNSFYPTNSIINHEEIHSKQQHKWGWFFLPAWIFCYLLILPVLWNPFRKKWEMEAYTQGSGYSEEEAKRILRTVHYGWLL